MLLRFAVAGSLIALTQPADTGGDLFQLIAMLVAAALCIGVWVRPLSLSSMVSIAGALDGHAVSALFAVLHAVIALSLTLTGAGAYSADARLFGRQRIRLPARDDTSE